jgi:DNA polymerase
MTEIVCVGEAWGENEERERQPFVGAAGYELTKMLEEAGIHRAECFLTNVINRRPPGNKIEAFCGGKSDGIAGYPALVRGKYLQACFESEMVRLGDELIEHNPNLIIALGNTAMWALLAKTAISKFRGTTAISTHTVTGFKVLPTYHPAAVLRQWDLRPVTVIDLMKAKRESAYPEIRRPKRTIYIPETLDDIHSFLGQCRQCKILAIDIETAGNQVTCIGFAPRPDAAIVIPILHAKRMGRSYWPTREIECAVWDAIRGILSSPTPSKLFQNGLYDIAFLWRAYGIKVYGAEHDTLLLHHALQPESLKSLGFLGSVYTDEGAWKQERRTATIKRDE